MEPRPLQPQVDLDHIHAPVPALARPPVRPSTGPGRLPAGAERCAVLRRRPHPRQEHPSARDLRHRDSRPAGILWLGPDLSWTETGQVGCPRQRSRRWCLRSRRVVCGLRWSWDQEAMWRYVVTDMMRAWVVSDPGSISGSPMALIERSMPIPALGEVLVRVLACGVCRTDLHLAEGELQPRRGGVVPGHEVV